MSQNNCINQCEAPNDESVLLLPNQVINFKQKKKDCGNNQKCSHCLLIFNYPHNLFKHLLFSGVDFAVVNLIAIYNCIYFFKVNNKNTRIRCEICSKLAIKTPEWRHCFRTYFSINICFNILQHVLIPLKYKNFNIHKIR